MKNKLFKIIFSLTALNNLASLAVAAPRTEFEKLEFIVEQLTEDDSPGEPRGVFPCWMFEPHYYNSGPAWLVGADNETGETSSENYKNSRFTNIKNQQYPDGAKRYFIPAFYMDLDRDSYIEERIAEGMSGPAAAESFSNYVADTFSQNEDGEFVGFISFKVKQVIEPYSPAKHQVLDEEGNPTGFDLPIFGPDEYRPPGLRIARPVIQQRFVKTMYNPTFGFTGMDGKFVASEICFDPQPHLPYIALRESIYDPFNTASGNDYNGSYNYGPDDVPTAIMYKLFLNDYMERRILSADRVEIATNVGLILLRFINVPANVIMIGVDLYNCEKAGDPYCMGHAITDGVTTAGAIVKVSKYAAQGARVFNRIRGSHIANSMIYGGIAGNVTLSYLHARRGEILASAGSALNTVLDLAPIIIKRARLIGSRLGRTQGGQCSVNPDPVPVKVKNMASDSQACQGGCITREISSESSYCKLKLSDYFGPAIKQADMEADIKPFERLENGSVIRNPEVTTFSPDQKIMKIPVLPEGQKLIYVVVKDKANVFGFKIKIAVEKPMGTYVDPGSGISVTATWGHPTMIGPEEQVLYAGEIIDEGDRLVVNNLSGRVCADPRKDAAGLAVVHQTLARMIKDPRISSIAGDFKRGVSYGRVGNLRTNEGASSETHTEDIRDLLDRLFSIESLPCAIRNND